jgi:hypothetical protein
LSVMMGVATTRSRYWKISQKPTPIDIIEHKINQGLGETSRDLFETASDLTCEGDVVVRITGLSCIILWSITAFFDGGQNSGRVLALLMVLMVLLSAPNLTLADEPS